MATHETFPENWQEQVLTALEKMRTADPTKAVFGVMLPESWKSELEVYSRSGELRRLFGLRAIAFGGKTISPFDGPKETKTTKKAG